MHKDPSAMVKTRERAIASLASQPTPSARDNATREFEHEKLLKEIRSAISRLSTPRSTRSSSSTASVRSNHSTAPPKRFLAIRPRRSSATMSNSSFPDRPSQPRRLLPPIHDEGAREIAGIRREVVGKRKDGSTAPLELSIAEWRDTDGRPCFAGIMRDVTLRNMQARALQEAIDVASRRASRPRAQISRRPNSSPS